MESGRKKSVADFFRANKRSLIEAALILILLILSLTAYLLIRGRDEGEDAWTRGRNQALQQAIFHYRLQSYEKAELLLHASLESSSRREKSLVLLYLGNIAFQRGRYQDAMTRYLEAHRVNRKNPHPLYNAALAACRQGRYVQAQELAARSVDAGTSYGPALLLLGNLRLGAGKVQEAVRLYDRARDYSPLARYNMARCLLRLGKQGPARRGLTDLTEDSGVSKALRGMSAAGLAELNGFNDPDAGAGYLGEALEVYPSAALRYNRAVLLTSAQRYNEAEQLLSSTKPEGSIAFQWKLMLNVNRYLNGRYRESLRGFEEMLRDGHREIARLAGDGYVKLGDFKQAERMYRRVLLAHPDPQVLANLVHLLMQEGRLQEALDSAMDYAGRHDGPEGHIYTAEVYFEMGSREQGLQIMKVARERVLSTDQRLRIARVFLNAGMPDNALELLSVLEDERARLALAELYRSTGHMDRASRVLEQLRRRTADTVIHYRVTLELASLKAPAASLELYDELMADFPHRYQAYHNAALALMRQGKFEDAVSTVQRCLTTCSDLQPSSLSDLYVILGAAQYHHGNRAEATRFFRQAGSLNPKSDLPVINLKVLEQTAKQRDKQL